LNQCKQNRAFMLSLDCSILLALLALCSPQPVLADGGAPNLAYVAGSQQGIGIIDVAQRKVTEQFSVAGNPYMVLLSLDGGLLYVTQPATGRVVALAAKTGQIVCSVAFPGYPALLALSADGTVLYIAGIGETTIYAVDSQTCALQRSFQSPEPVSWLAATGVTTNNAFQTQLWLAGNSAVIVLNEQGQVLDSISIPGGPRFLSLPGGLTAYVATIQGSVVAVDMLTHEVFAMLITGGTFGSMDYDAVTQDIYVPDEQHNQVDVLTPVLDGSGLVPQEPSRVIPLSSSPRAIAVTNDGAFGFVALSDGTVAMLDIPARQLVSTISVGGQPRFIITGPYPPQDIPTIQPAPAPQPLILLLVVAAALLGILLVVFWIVRQRYRRYRNNYC